MKFTLSEIKKTLLSKLNFTPGTKIRTECVLFKCPVYKFMLLLNNNSDLEQKVVCPKVFCKRVQKGNFMCQLTNNRFDIMKGAHIDFEFYSYASLLTKAENFDDTPEPAPKVVRTPVREQVVEEPEEVVEETQPEPEEDFPSMEDATSKLDTDEYITRLTRDMNELLDIRTFKDFIMKGPDFLMFSNPFVTDLSKSSIKIPLDTIENYKHIYMLVREYFGDYLAVRKATSCKGCPNEKSKPYSPLCTNCFRNEAIMSLTDIQKADNFGKSLGGLV